MNLPSVHDYCRTCGGIRPEWYSANRVRGWLHLACKCCGGPCPPGLPDEVTFTFSGVNASACGCTTYSLNGNTYSFQTTLLLLDGTYTVERDTLQPSTCAYRTQFAFGSDRLTFNRYDNSPDSSCSTTPDSVAGYKGLTLSCNFASDGTIQNAGATLESSAIGAPEAIPFLNFTGGWDNGDEIPNGFTCSYANPTFFVGGGGTLTITW